MRPSVPVKSFCTQGSRPRRDWHYQKKLRYLGEFLFERYQKRPWSTGSEDESVRCTTRARKQNSFVCARCEILHTLKASNRKCSSRFRNKIMHGFRHAWLRNRSGAKF